jgi:TolB protein
LNPKYRNWLVVIGMVAVTSVVLVFVMNNSRDKVEINWTPKGEWIVFFCGVFPNTSPKSNLYIMRPDGSELQRITTNDFVAKDPSWSSDGQWIAFLSGKTIFRTKPDGTQVEKVITLPLSRLENLGSVALSPEGDWAAYEVTDFDGSYIRRISTNGEGIQTIVSASDLVERQKWSPDGQFIAYAEISALPSSGIYVVDKDGNGRKQVLRDLGLKGQLNWSPNGDELLISIPNGQQKSLFRLNLNNNELTPINAGYFWDSPALSPDGEWIIYEGYDNNARSAGLYKARSDGSTTKRLTQMDECAAFGPRWFDFNTINS